MIIYQINFFILITLRGTDVTLDMKYFLRQAKAV